MELHKPLVDTIIGQNSHSDVIMNNLVKVIEKYIARGESPGKKGRQTTAQNGVLLQAQRCRISTTRGKMVRPLLSPGTDSTGVTLGKKQNNKEGQ
jgi:hypothetical protein